MKCSNQYLAIYIHLSLDCSHVIFTILFVWNVVHEDYGLRENVYGWDG